MVGRWVISFWGKRPIFRRFLLLDSGRVHIFQTKKHVVVSENSGTPKSSILIGFSIINHPFWEYPYFLETPKSTTTSFKDQNTSNILTNDDPRISFLKLCANVPWFLAAEVKVDFSTGGYTSLGIQTPPGSNRIYRVPIPILRIGF